MHRSMTLKQRITLGLAAFLLALAAQIFLSFYQSGTVLRELDDQMGRFNAISRFQDGVERSLTALSDYRWEYGDADELEASIRRAMRQIETERKLEALAPVQPEPMEPAAPAAEPDDAENSQNALVMAHVRRYLEDNYMFDISLDSVGEILHISPAYLSAQFKKYQNMNFLDCLTELRINAAKELLTDPFRSSAEVASMVGYEDASYFARAFKKRTGETPTQYRKHALREKRSPAPEGLL